MSLILESLITNKEIELSVQTLQNVHKRLEYIRYGRFIPKADIPLEYVAFDPIDADEVLSISDKSGSFTKNNTKETSSFLEPHSFTGKFFTSEATEVLFTEKFRILSTGKVAPFWYAHRLPDSTISASLQRVTQLGASSVDSTLYEVAENNTYLFSDLLNSFDEESGRYELFYVNSVDSSGVRTVELYNPINAFHKATFDDINPTTSTLDRDSNAYLVSSSATIKTFTLPRYSTYYVRELGTKRIQVLRPVLDQPDDPWLVRVTNGEFSQLIDGTKYNYSIEEYDLQSFIPIKPYRLAINELAIRITKGLIKLQRENVFIDSDNGYHIDIILLDKKTGNVQRALSTNPLKEDTKYSDTDIEYEMDLISDWDNKSGIVRLSSLIVREDHEIRVFYTYDEQTYEYSTLNLNPSSNTDLLDKMVVIYIVPNTKGTGENSIYHLIVRDNIILDCSQTGGTTVPNLSLFLEDGTPNPDSIIGTIYLDDGSYDGLGFTDRFPSYLVLAEITFLEPSRIEDAVRIDVRQPGGGIDPETALDAVRANPHVAYFPGVAPSGGYKYPNKSTLLVKVPYTLLTTYSGELTDNIVRDHVEKHTNAGEYVIIEYDGVIPEFIDIEPGECITLRWHRENPDYSFKIYRSLYKDRGFSLLTTVEGSAYNNEYEDCSVTSGIAYFYYITAVSPDNIEGPRSIVYGARAL